MIATARWKLVTDPSSLFATDYLLSLSGPEPERRPLRLSQHPVTVRHARIPLARLLRSAHGRPSAPAQSQVSEDVQARLRALGYIDGP